MTNYNERLDEILNTLGERHIMVEHCLIHTGEQNGKNIETRKAKQAILRWVADEVIGEDEAAAEYSYLPPTLDEMTKSAHEKAVRNQLRAEQRARVK